MLPATNATTAGIEAPVAAVRPTVPVITAIAQVAAEHPSAAADRIGERRRARCRSDSAPAALAQTATASESTSTAVAVTPRDGATIERTSAAAVGASSTTAPQTTGTMTATVVARRVIGDDATCGPRASLPGNDTSARAAPSAAAARQVPRNERACRRRSSRAAASASRSPAPSRHAANAEPAKYETATTTDTSGRCCADAQALRSWLRATSSSGRLTAPLRDVGVARTLFDDPVFDDPALGAR